MKIQHMDIDEHLLATPDLPEVRKMLQRIEQEWLVVHNRLMSYGFIGLLFLPSLRSDVFWGISNHIYFADFMLYWRLRQDDPTCRVDAVAVLWRDGP